MGAPRLAYDVSFHAWVIEFEAGSLNATGVSPSPPNHIIASGINGEDPFSVLDGTNLTGLERTVSPPSPSAGSSSARSWSFTTRCRDSIRRALRKNWVCCRRVELMETFVSKGQSQSRRRSTIQFMSSSSCGKCYSRISSNDRDEKIKEAIIYCKMTMGN